ncbi:hypothetical protein V1283_000462 [Bradyrhizobium sp. AZCC 2262]|uniref:hypothetical protein n=1 Tax=Bradyrhizobium sp. AZCC 2262 TaxID=3117022 RepID=UPI002FF0BE70
MSKQSEFSPTQVEQLAEIPQSNHQVGWIVGDDDLRNFYKSLLDNYGDKIQAGVASKLVKLIAEEEPNLAEDDGIPL